MDKSLKLIFIVMLVLLAMLFLILARIFYGSGNTRKTTNNNIISNNIENTTENSIENTNNEKEEQNNEFEEKIPVVNGAYFYTVENCINEYVSSIKLLQNNNSEENKKGVYGKLSNSYIKQNNINIDNVENIKIKSDCYLLGAINMIQQNKSNNYVIRYAVRTIFSDNSKNIYYFNFIVYLDYANLTFAIEPAGENETDLSKIELRADIDYIDENDYNKYSCNVIAQDGILENYVSFFRKLCYNSPEIAYSYLSDECKKNKYPTIDSFRHFLSNNNDKIKYMQVLRCDNVTEQEEDTIYICSNISGGYLTIDERSIMDFKISLSF